MVAVILAGGKGRRLKPFTSIIPKPLFPVGEKPILQIIIEQLISFGINDFIISLGYLGELIEAYFGDGSKLNCNISYIRETHPLGTAGPISLLPELDDDFIFMNGDILTTLDFGKAYKQHKANSAMMTVCTYKKKVKSSLGVLEIDNKNNVRNYFEKPETKHTVSSGIYVLNPKISKFVDKNNKMDLPDLVLKVINSGFSVKAYNIDGYWFDIGTPEDLEFALEFIEGGQD